MTDVTACFSKQKRRVAGLMSGTSLDGVDVAIAQFAGCGRALEITLEGFLHVPYAPALRDVLLAQSHVATSDVKTIAQLNLRLAQVYAEAIRQTTAALGLAIADLDVIGSHGQTIHHVPQPEDCAGAATISTLQIGDPSALAQLLGVPVVGDFRVADMALGGQGAPLVPYFDYVHYADEEETRGLLNLGGIANLTILPASADQQAVYAFDTGPANMLMDALVQRFFNQPYDENGQIAARGMVHQDVLSRWMQTPFFHESPPKSTGREQFGIAFLDTGLFEAYPLEDLIATATAFTPQSVYAAYEQFVAPQHELDVLMVSGGGVHNATLMQFLRDQFAPIRVAPLADWGLDPDAKEALCFAVLAHEYLNGVPTNMPAVTGASRPARLGKLCIP